MYYCGVCDLKHEAFPATTIILACILAVSLYSIDFNYNRSEIAPTCLIAPASCVGGCRAQSASGSRGA